MLVFLCPLRGSNFTAATKSSFAATLANPNRANPSLRLQPVPRFSKRRNWSPAGRSALTDDIKCRTMINHEGHQLSNTATRTTAWDDPSINQITRIPGPASLPNRRPIDRSKAGIAHLPSAGISVRENRLPLRSSSRSPRAPCLTHSGHKSGGLENASGPGFF